MLLPAAGGTMGGDGLGANATGLTDSQRGGLLRRMAENLSALLFHMLVGCSYRGRAGA